ncbi:MAG TPA: Ig-like domain-containing protein [Gemmatimonadales bacterium]|nr:Ig-like domain-containing protein [Gemmatimonadales bacterium]
MREDGFGSAALLILVCACGDGPTDPPPAGNTTALVIAPGALLLPAHGTTASLEAYAVDADGDSTRVEATFRSSDPTVVSMDADGVAVGGAAIGSAQIVATSGELTSPPILALRATPSTGALLVADSQVIGPVQPVDPSAPYGVGREIRVRLRGISPAVGQLVIGTGGAPVGGRVVSVSAPSGDAEVVLALVPLGELFAEISINERLPLTGALPTESSSDRHGVRLTRTAGGSIRFAAPAGARYQAAATGTIASAGRIEQEFDLGPFKCKLEVPAPLVVPITMGTFSGDLNEALALDLLVESGVVRRFVVNGTIRPTLTVAPRITAALEGKAECKYKIREFPLPVGGFLSLFLGGQVPLGIGFELGAKTTLGQLGADVTFASTIAAQVGFDCTAACQWVQEFDGTAPTITVTPVIPNLATSTRLEMGVSVFGWADLTLGLTLWEDETTRVKLLSAKAGLEQKFELASADAQAADPAYASSYGLKPVIEVKAGAEYAPLENLLQVTLTLFTYAPELDPISRSARGSFTITPASVAAGDGSQLGDMATFTVTLTDATYLGAYAIEAVQIRWRRMVGETVVLESGRPGCSDLEAAQDQLTFTCQTDFLAEHAGAQTFHAFARTRIFGVPVPVPLELAADARAVVTVGEPSLLRWTFDLDNDGWEEGVSGDGTVFHLGREGGVLKLHGVDEAVGEPNAWIYKAIDLPPGAQSLAVRVSAHDRDGATVAWRLRLVDAGGTSHTLHGWEVLTGAEGVHLWVDRSASIAAWAGTPVTVYVEQDDNGQHEHEHFYISEISIIE